MFRFFYSLTFYLAVPLLLLRLLYRSIKAPAYRKRWKERFGYLSTPEQVSGTKKTIWVHGVSVGETLAAVPLVKYLLTTYPDYQIVFTTMTPTGSERAINAFGNKVVHTYMPYDLPGAMGRFLRTINPQMLILLETELWPNSLAQCKKQGVRTLLVNARMSQKSANGYKKIAATTDRMINSIDCIAAQAKADADRFIDLGADPAKVKVTGSLKFDLSPPEINKDSMPRIFQQALDARRPVLIAASTREGEDEKILAAFSQIQSQEPATLLVIVPRHPERFDVVAKLVDEHDLTYVLRSDNAELSDSTQVLVGDSMGEMWQYYSLATIAFVGGSLVNTGCHNVLEPAALGIPVLAGPSQFNFETICNELQEAGAMLTVSDEVELATKVVELLRDNDKRAVMSRSGKQFVINNKGSLAEVISLVKAHLE